MTIILRFKSVCRSRDPTVCADPISSGAGSGSEKVQSVCALGPHKAAAFAGSLPPY